jgi:hypothetical protein
LKKNSAVPSLVTTFATLSFSPYKVKKAKEVTSPSRLDKKKNHDKTKYPHSETILKLGQHLTTDGKINRLVMVFAESYSQDRSYQNFHPDARTCP